MPVPYVMLPHVAERPQNRLPRRDSLAGRTLRQSCAQLHNELPANVSARRPGAAATAPEDSRSNSISIIIINNSSSSRSRAARVNYDSFNVSHSLLDFQLKTAKLCASD